MNDPDKPRLLLTGATGFLGRSILEQALAQGFDVHATSHRAVQSAGVQRKSARWHEIDLRDSEAAARLVRKVAPTHIINAAWDTRHSLYWTSAENELWAATALAMIDAFAASGGSRFVQVGTCAEYQWGRDGPIREGRTPERPATPYGRAKLIVHEALHAAAAQAGFSAATARIFFAYGPFENEARIIPALCRALASRADMTIANPEQVRDPLFVTDAARAIVQLAGAFDLAGAVNIGSGTAISLGQVARQLESIAGSPGCITYGGANSGEHDTLIADVSKLASIGWTPLTDLWQGLRDTFRWWSAR